MCRTNPVCNSCEHEMTRTQIGEVNKTWRCKDVKCQEYDLNQGINDAVQPLSDCGVPLYQHAEHCMLCGDSDNKPAQAIKGITGAETIALREAVYGPFAVHAKAEQGMKRAMTSQAGWEKLNDIQKSAAEMIVHKLARILNNSADYADNWHDIAGYATLAEADIEKRVAKTET